MCMVSGINRRDDAKGQRCAWLLAGVLSFVLAGLAVAQEPGENTLTPSQLKRLSLEDLMAVKVETVYGASKHTQTLNEAPAAVSLVGEDDIRKFGYRTLSDILRSVRGFYIGGDGDYDTIGFRGFSRPGDYGGRVLLLVDGHRMNDPLYDSATSGLDFPLDIDLIDHVEVVRGPGFSLYGNNAFYSVINVVTRRGGQLRGAEVSGAAASYDSFSGRLSYGTQLTNGLEFLVSARLYDSAGRDRIYYPEFAAINHGYADHLDAEKAKQFFLSAAWGDFSLEGLYGAREKHFSTAMGLGTVFDDPRTRTIDGRGMLDLKYEHEFEPDWQFNGRLFYDYYDYEAYFPYDPLDSWHPTHVILNEDVGHARWWGGDFQVSHLFAERHRLCLGTEFNDDLRLQLQNFDVAPSLTYQNNHSTATSVGIYLQDEYTIRTNLLLDAAVRYDYFDTFGGKVNLRGGLIYSPWAGTTLKFIYGEGYRAPNDTERNYVANGYLPNSGLQPEMIRSYELIWEQRWSEHWRASVSLFYNELRDLIVQTTNPDETFIYRNGDAVDMRGAEAELEGRWAGGWRGRASYGYANVRDNLTGQTVVNSPRHNAKLNLSVPLYGEKIFASFEVQGLSRRETRSGNWVSGYFLLNGTIYSRELVRNLELSAGVYNLLDSRYRTPVGADYVPESVEQIGRTFRVKVTYRF